MSDVISQRRGVDSFQALPTREGSLMHLSDAHSSINTPSIVQRSCAKHLLCRSHPQPCCWCCPPSLSANCQSCSLRRCAEHIHGTPPRDTSRRTLRNMKERKASGTRNGKMVVCVVLKKRMKPKILQTNRRLKNYHPVLVEKNIPTSNK